MAKFDPEVRIVLREPFMIGTPPGIDAEMNLIDKFRRQTAPPITPDTGWCYVDPIAPATPDDVDDTLDDWSPLFMGAWANIGGDLPALAFKITMSGRVKIRGAITGGAPGSTIFVLPLGFRPAKRVRRVMASEAAGVSVTVDVYPNGNVVFVG